MKKGDAVHKSTGYGGRSLTNLPHEPLLRQ